MDIHDKHRVTHHGIEIMKVSCVCKGMLGAVRNVFHEFHVFFIFQIFYNNVGGIGGRVQ